jgi:hypothetical protein
MAEAPSSTFNPRRPLQLQSSSPTSSLVTFNVNPHCQLHPSSPTSTPVAFQFPNPVTFLFPPLLLDARGVLMQQLLDEVVTQIIIHSIKDKLVFHF